MSIAIKTFIPSNDQKMHPLDNVIWQALTTRQAHFAVSFRSARRFPREVSPLCGFAEPSDESYTSLAALFHPGATAAVFLNEQYVPHAEWDYVVGAPLLQMVCEHGVRVVEFEGSTTNSRVGNAGLPRDD